MRSAMASDLSSLWDYEITETVEMRRDGSTVRYTAVMENLDQTEVDTYGGPDSVSMRKIHFKTADIKIISPGEIIYVLEPDPVNRGAEIRSKKVVVSATLSECGSELIVTCRS